ncbi:MAG: hypothetical protein GX108_07625 [Thermovirga sp.]|nr:hypothetical protein [Thermovirga sp.]
MTTRIGRISIRVPQMRGGGLDTEELKLLPRFEQAFLLTLLEMVIDGVSTRKVRRVMEEFWGLEVSKSTALRLFGLLHGRVADWNERPLEGTDYPFLQEGSPGDPGEGKPEGRQEGHPACHRCFWFGVRGGSRHPGGPSRERDKLEGVFHLAQQKRAGRSGLRHLRRP